MRSNVDGTTAAYLQTRRGLIRRNFVWVEAKNRDTGGLETMGLWDGEDTVTVTVQGGQTGLPATREYHAAGSLLQIDPIPLTTDLTIRSVRIRLSPISDAVQQLIRGYDPREAPVEVHRGLFDLETRQIIAAPLPRFVGWINGDPINTPAPGDEGVVEVDCVSHTRALTKINPSKRSDEYQRTRNGDRYRRYTDVASQWQVFWGERRGR